MPAKITMFWPFRHRQRTPERWHAPKIKFVGEQDGTPERQLKQEWGGSFAKRPHVQRAFLAKVVYDNPQVIDVALAIKTSSGPDKQLEKELGQTFSRIFNRDTHLDIFFLSPEQETEALAVCRPFYEGG